MRPMTRGTARRIHLEIGRQELEVARGLVRVQECSRVLEVLNIIMLQERWVHQELRAVGHRYLRNLVRCQLLTDLSIFNQISSSIGKVSIVSLLADLVLVTL